MAAKSGAEDSLPTSSEAALLEVRDLHVEFQTPQGLVKAVNGASFSLGAGESVALLGESGSGKSVTAQAILGIVDTPPGRVAAGEVLYRGCDLLRLTEKELASVRGQRVAMVFQDPLASLNPVQTVGRQVGEMFEVHRGASAKEGRRSAVELLDRVRVPNARGRVDDYPHQFSGGMRQRVMIAMALALEPELLIADEPTTALDVTVQADIMALLNDLQRDTGMGLLLITHDLAVVAETVDRVCVMYAGRIVETAPVQDAFADPRHPYTRGLLTSVPRIDRRQRLIPITGAPPRPSDIPSGCEFEPRCSQAVELCRTTRPELVALGAANSAACHFADVAPVAGAGATGVTASSSGAPPAGEVLLSVQDLHTRYSVRRATSWRSRGKVINAVDGVNFEIRSGETLGLVGESGCGKSTVARTLLGIEKSQAGRALYHGDDILRMDRRRLHQFRRNVQMVFQDPYSSLDPRMSVADLVAEPWVVHPEVAPKGSWREAVKSLLERVGLDPDHHVDRFPRQFSGGQLQRIGIARALAVNPELIICDEAVSALDVSVQAQVVNLLQDIQAETQVSYLFIAHDLAVVRQIADRVAVMYLGKIVEYGDAEDVFDHPVHPYTQTLMSAVPVPNPEERSLHTRVDALGELPDREALPQGCGFRDRCQHAHDLCAEVEPVLRERESASHIAACHLDWPRSPAGGVGVTVRAPRRA